jgi:hypothetical protein
VHIRPGTGSYNGNPEGALEVAGLNTAQSARIRVLRSGVPIPAYTHDYAPAAPSEANFSPQDITAGDVIEVQQPQGAVVETFTVPNVSLTGTAGSPNVTGHGPDGAYVVATYEAECFGSPEKDFRVTPQGGAFSLAYPKVLTAGGNLEVRAFPGKGDSVDFFDRIPGETPCFEAYAYDYPPYPDSLPATEPYRIEADSMRQTIATSSRIVLRRAGAAVVDFSDAGASQSIGKTTAVRPSAGDIIELYRPQGAPQPVATFTIPSVKAVYDGSNSLVAVDAPPATRLAATARSIFQMYSNSRFALNTANGRTLLNFAVSQTTESALDLSQLDFFLADWESGDQHGRVQVNITPGDLTAPTLGIKLASKFKLAKLGSSFKVSVSSSEAAKATLTLTLPAKLKGVKSSKTKSPTKVASANASLVAGNNKLKLKITKAGKKLLKRIRAKHLPTQTATLTVTAIDQSGNATTKVKTTKLAAK